MILNNNLKMTYSTRSCNFTQFYHIFYFCYPKISPIHISQSNINKCIDFSFFGIQTDLNINHTITLSIRLKEVCVLKTRSAALVPTHSSLSLSNL